MKETIGKKLDSIMSNPTKFSEALKVVNAKLASDKELRQAYVANIAMSFMDTHAQFCKKSGKRNPNKSELHAIANDAAEHFLWLLNK